MDKKNGCQLAIENKCALGRRIGRGAAVVCVVFCCGSEIVRLSRRTGKREPFSCVAPHCTLSKRTTSLHTCHTLSVRDNRKVSISDRVQSHVSCRGRDIGGGRMDTWPEILRSRDGLERSSGLSCSVGRLWSSAFSFCFSFLFFSRSGERTAFGTVQRKLGCLFSLQ